MPNYNVECSDCDFASELSIKLFELDQWDLDAKCPNCQAAAPNYRRVMIYAPASTAGAKSADKAKQSHKESQHKRFIHSGTRDDMRHRQEKKTNHEQVAAARESVKKGEFEGFKK